MIIGESLAAVTARQLSGQFYRPSYEGYALAQLPQTIRALLGDVPAGLPLASHDMMKQSYEAVILLMADAFGWRFFAEHVEQHPFLRRIVDQGVVCKLSSQFPSTTVANVTTLHTGLPVGQSGLYEWYFYEPLLDAVIAPLLFSMAGDHARDSLAAMGVRPQDLYPQESLYRDLARSGVRSFVLQRDAYAFSTYTQAVTSDAQIVPYGTLPEALARVARLLEQQQGPTYYYLYYDGIDTALHIHGPGSHEARVEIAGFLDVLEQHLLPLLGKRPGRTLLLLTADHGQTAVDPATTIYLNQSLPALIPLLATSRAGKPIVPVGACRDLFLHLVPGCLEEAHGLLCEHLAGRAEVYRVDELVAQGVFGAVSPALCARLGDLVILPHAGESVWWWEPGRFEQRFRGAHGGLSRDELEIPLLMMGN